MQLPNFLKRLLNQDPPEPSPENLEAFDQKNKEKQAYQASYNEGRIEAEKRRGKQDGLTHGLKPNGGHGIKATLGTVAKGMNQVGEFGLQMQKNLGNMFELDTPEPKKRKQS